MIRQKVPFPGKRGLMRGMTEKEADAAAIDVVEVANRVAREVKTAYYELSHALQRRGGDPAQQADPGKPRSNRIKTGYALGEGMQQEVLAAHLEIARMVDELLMLEQNRAALEAKLAWLLLTARRKGFRAGPRRSFFTRPSSTSSACSRRPSKPTPC